MAGSTPVYGFPYPQGTDLVADYPALGQSLATGVETVAIAKVAYATPTNPQTGTTYTFALTDANLLVTANNASASTYTVPPQSSVTWVANTILRVTNIGAGVVTFAAGAGVTVTNTAATLAQYQSANIIRTASNTWIVIPSDVSTSGLTLITAQSFSAVSTVSVNNCFTSTYETYRINMKVLSSANNALHFRLRSSGSDNATSNYIYQNAFGYNGANVAGSGAVPNTLGRLGQISTNNCMVAFDFAAPGAAENKSGVSLTTRYQGSYNEIYMEGNYITLASAFDGITFSLGAAGTMTGTLRIYGYRNSV